MQFRTGKPIAVAILACLSALVVNPAGSQAVKSGAPPVRESRIDLFAGYSYLHPQDSSISNFYYQPLTKGTLLSVTGYFNRYLGVQAEGGLHPSGPNDCVYTAQGGPIARYQINRWVPFVHVLGGGAKVGGPQLQSCVWGYGITAGTGVDYILPYFHDHFAVRPIQADYNYNHVDHGPLLIPGGYVGGLTEMNAYRLSAGIVYRIGDMTPSVAASLSCIATPGSVFAGEPVTVTSSAIGLNPKRKINYFWTSTGGKITGAGETVQVGTDGLAGGSYTVSGRVSQGTKAHQQATCSAQFQVKIIEPPTITCSANPSSVHPGESSTITSVGVSPQNRPLTYSFSTSAGMISGQANIATLNSAGAVPGDITVTCNVIDDKGQMASARTAVTIVPNPPAPVPVSRPLCSIDFNRDPKRPARVNNEAKGCLDDVALTLQREADSKLVMIGNAAPGETAALAAERASNAKLYLTQEKGIDSSRVNLRTGSAGTKSVSNLLVPTGASADAAGTEPVIEDSISHHGQAYGKTKLGAPTKRKRK